MKCVLLGSVTKVNRKTAELGIQLSIRNPQDYEDIEVFFLEIDGGLVPFFVDELRVKAADVFLILAVDYSDALVNQRFLGCRVFVGERPGTRTDDKIMELSMLIGFRISDVEKGFLGHVEDVMMMSGQSLLKISYQNREVLIPLVQEFVVSMDEEKKQLIVNLPEGLLDINTG